MSIIKLANQLNENESGENNFDKRLRNTTTGDYVIPSSVVGAGLGTVAGGMGGSGFFNTQKKFNLPSTITGALGGNVLGSLAGAASSPVSSRVGNISKYTGDKIWQGNPDISDESKSATSAAFLGTAAGGLTGKRLKSVGKVKGASGLKGAVIGGGTLGGGNYLFEKSVQRGKERRKNNELKRKEAEELKNKLKEYEEGFAE